jgi:8-hydroxy-5-deazaflavin:NADPH oxidoreductase
MESIEKTNPTYAIIGFGKVGQALAGAFARSHIKVAVATTRDPQTFASTAANIGTEIIATTLEDAAKADVIFLAVRFENHPDVAKVLADWQGKIIVDVTNAYGISAEKLAGKPSAHVVAEAFRNAHVVKGFNHLIAEVLAQAPDVHGGKRVVFLAGDDGQAVGEIAELAKRLGFSPVSLGKIAEGGLLVQAHDNIWGHLIFKDLINFK